MEGKTSVLNMLKNYLLAHEGDNILISTFNPWILKNEETMLMEFFNVLVKESIFKKSAENGKRKTKQSSSPLLPNQLKIRIFRS